MNPRIDFPNSTISTLRHDFSCGQAGKYSYSAFPTIANIPKLLRACLFPLLWPERLPVSDGQWDRSTLCVQIVEGVRNVRVSVRGRVHEPLRRVDLLRQDKSKEDEQRANVQARVETRRCDVVVVAPPAPETALDKAVEEDADRAPAQVDVHCSRRDPAGATEDKRPMQVTNAASREALGEEPCNDGKCSAEQPVPLQSRVDATGAKHSRRADDTPDNGCSVENTGTRAGVAVGLVRLADTRDSAQSPVEDSDLDDAGPNTSDDLRRKSDTGLE